jgi:hypothetical protein
MAGYIAGQSNLLSQSLHPLMAISKASGDCIGLTDYWSAQVTTQIE